MMFIFIVLGSIKLVLLYGIVESKVKQKSGIQYARFENNIITRNSKLFIGIR